MGGILTVATTEENIKIQAASVCDISMEPRRDYRTMRLSPLKEIELALARKQELEIE
jgi:hypothetical protein